MSFLANCELILGLLRPTFSSAIIAGGYLRDRILGIEPKDIDVFLPASQEGTPEMAEVLTAAMGVPVKAEFNLSYANMEVRRVFTTGSAMLLPVQFIELEDAGPPEARVPQHDFGLCQVWHDGHQLRAMEAFTRDREARTCTLVHCESAAEHARSMRRWDRLRKRLTGFTLVDTTEWAVPQ